MTVGAAIGLVALTTAAVGATVARLFAGTPLDAERNWQPGFPTGEDN